MIKSSNLKKIHDILSINDECFYQIPPYQRAYTWGKTEWEDLFNDLYVNTEGYFLGSLICVNQGQEKYEVIDGQQRLTTLSILLLSLYSYIEDLRQKVGFDFMADENENENKLYIWLKKAIRINIKENKLKLVLSIQNENNKDWEYLVKEVCNVKGEKKPSNYGNRRIYKAYSCFKILINTNLIIHPKDENQQLTLEEQKQSFGNLFNFLKKVYSANLIKIETDNEQSAFLLFESLNNRGIPLSAIDLIKNKILEKIGGNSNDVENNNKKWQIILNSIGEKPNLQERFLRHFYMTYIDILPNQNLNKENGEIVIPKVTKSNLIDLYNQQINSKKNAILVLEKLIEKSDVYGLLINPENLNNQIEVDKKYYDKLINLKHLGVSSSYMLLSFLFDKYKDQDFSELLDYLEFWFICRHATNEPATNKLDTIFVDLVKLQKGSYDFKEIKLELNKYLDKHKIETALKNPNLYEDMSAVVRNFLIRLEQSSRSKQTKTDFWKLTEPKNTKQTKKSTEGGKLVWSIEHIYPQKPKNENDWGDNEQNKQLKERLHSLGNLTLTCYNSSYSNKKYAEKCSVVVDDKAVGLRNGDMKINQELPEPSNTENTWTFNKIDERTKWLIEEFMSFMDKKE